MCIVRKFVCLYTAGECMFAYNFFIYVYVCVCVYVIESFVVLPFVMCVHTHVYGSSGCQL